MPGTSDGGFFLQARKTIAQIPVETIRNQAPLRLRVFKIHHMKAVAKWLEAACDFLARIDMMRNALICLC
jgi:hypothetical protein